MNKELNSISEIQKEISRLKRHAESIKKKTRTKVINEIIRSMVENDLNLEDIAQVFHHKPSQRRMPAKIKYQHPNGDTWSGRGRPPAWIKQIESEGRSREDFAVNNENRDFDVRNNYAVES
ncbi:DNA-binding protein [Alcaligenes faecalis]|uniref:DNA-binding protein n=1 Tax=Alcaligenes faecalis TaxID=511 RepID=A0A1Z3ML29_ALCFA|nr:H-NS histone family protein [Alcaligenes faecalis]ASD48421.1 DNA-binding protein [Alcaligenes faecalis]OSZ33110.1 DNA-binding protein [Alcaligenes faecalis]OSZ41180.1 DNA-binding protein [Alcaligenes faecalis]